MKKTFFFLLLSFLLSAQRVEYVKFNGNIKDKNSKTKSLTFVDNRTDKVIGTITDKNETAEIKFENEDLKKHIEKWFSDDNKKLGNTDIVVMLEDLKVYNEKDENKDFPYAKLKIKISSFLKRNDKYYFINRFDNVIVCNPKTTAHAQRYLAPRISDIITEFIRASYSNIVSGAFIHENEINNYN
jgi:hypothetical protein